MYKWVKLYKYMYIYRIDFVDLNCASEDKNQANSFKL